MLAPGTKIGPRYTIESLLGQGGMSNLYLARDAQAGGAIRVIKEMTASYADPNEQRMANDLFQREANLLSQLNHPNIPKVFHMFQFQGKYYLNMEYVQGEDMGKLIQTAGKPLEEKDVANWGHQMATVLYYLHRQNPPIVFRDVKPSNIMIAGDQVKLIDFGIARLFTPAKKGDTMRIGSPGYAPPEQYSGQTDPRSDIYALGVTLHHALTGHDPTVSQTPFLIPPARSLNPRLSDEMVRILEKATQLDPDKRYPSMIEMKRDLQVVMRKHGMVVGASTPLSPLVAQASSSPVSGAPASTPAPTPTAATPATGQPVAASSGPASAGATIPGITPKGIPPSGTPTPSPPPVVATGASAGSTTPPRRSLGWVVGVLFVGAGLAATAALAPQQISRVRQEVSQAFAPARLPADPAVAAPSLYQRGGPLPVVLDLVEKARQTRPSDPDLILINQNALALQSGLALARWAVALPENEARPELLRGLVLAQKILNDRGGVDQAQLVLEVGSYTPGNFTSAYQAAAQGRWGRPVPSTPLKGVLIFSEADFPWTKLLSGGSVPTFVVGSKETAVPNDVHYLTLPSRPLGDLIKSAFTLEPSRIFWLASKTAAPEGVLSMTLDSKIAALLKEKSARLLVIDAGQAKALSEVKLPADVRVCLLAERWDQLPKVADMAGLKAVALAQGSPFCVSELQSAFYLKGPEVFGDAKPVPGSPGGSGYDGLLWAAQQGDGKWTGVSLKQDGQGKKGPAPWSQFEIRNDRWVFIRNVD